MLWREHTAHEGEQRRQVRDAQLAREAAASRVRGTARERLGHERGDDARRQAGAPRTAQQAGCQEDGEEAAVGSLGLPRDEQLQNDLGDRLVQRQCREQLVRGRRDGEATAASIGPNDLAATCRTVARAGDISGVKGSAKATAGWVGGDSAPWSTRLRGSMRTAGDVRPTSEREKPIRGALALEHPATGRTETSRCTRARVEEPV